MKETRSRITTPRVAQRARKYIYGTNLTEVQSKAIVTYPYRPSKGLTPSDETPLVVKIGDELPAVS